MRTVVDRVEALIAYLRSHGLSAGPFHRRVPLDEQRQLLRDFTSASAGDTAAADGDFGLHVLVCTDAAARGLDLSHVSHVVQVCPTEPHFRAFR